MARTGYKPELMRDPRPVPPGEIWIEVPDTSIMETTYLPGTRNTKMYPCKIGHWSGKRSYAALPYASLVSQDVLDLINSKGTGKGDVNGAPTTTIGNLATWANGTGTALGDGPSPASFATAAQGALAGTALQPGDPLTDLSSGAATSGQVPEANGTGGVAWVTPSGGSGITQLTGPITAGPGSGSQATTVTPGAITNTMLANEPDQTFKGRPVGAGAGAPQDLTANQASSVLDTATDPFVRTSAIPASLNANKTMAYVATY